jgi:type IX secretion system PorP/SprF family membrane protein
MKKWTKKLILICVFLPALAKTQQIVVNSLYHDVISYYNPAFTGTQHQLRGGIHYRNQWTKLNGAPVNYFGQYEQNFDSLNAGIGIVLMREEIGFSTFQMALVSYRYELKLSNLNRLSFGISGGFNNHIREPFWIVMNPDDPYLNFDKVSQTKFILNAGALLTLNNLSSVNILLSDR